MNFDSLPKKNKDNNPVSPLRNDQTGRSYFTAVRFFFYEKKNATSVGFLLIDRTCNSRSHLFSIFEPEPRGMKYEAPTISISVKNATTPLFAGTQQLPCADMLTICHLSYFRVHNINTLTLGEQ